MSLETGLLYDIRLEDNFENSVSGGGIVTQVSLQGLAVNDPSLIGIVSDGSPLPNAGIISDPNFQDWTGTFVAGHDGAGKAVDLGVDGNHLQLTPIGGGNFTLAGYFYLDSVDFASMERDSAPLFVDWSVMGRNFFVYVPTGGDHAGKLSFTSGAGTDEQSADLRGPQFPMDQWVHVIAKRVGDTIQLYLDGVLVAEESGVLTGGDTSYISDDVVNGPHEPYWNYHGSHYHPGGIDSDPYWYNKFGIGGHSYDWGRFPGKIDKVLIYDRALSADEVVELHNNNGEIQGEDNMNVFIQLENMEIDGYPSEITVELQNASGALLAELAAGASGDPASWDTGLDASSPVSDYKLVIKDSYGDGSFTATGAPNRVLIGTIEGGVFNVLGSSILDADDVDILENSLGGAKPFHATFSVVSAAEMSITHEFPADPKRQRTRVKAQYQVNNESDAPDASYHFIQTSGEAPMADEYSPAGFQFVSTAGWLSYNLSNVIGTDSEQMVPAVVWDGTEQYVDADTIIGSTQQLDAALDDHVTRLASQTGSLDAGASLVGFDLHQGTNESFFIADGTVQSAIEAIINEIDVFKSDETVSGSIKGTVDDAITAAITGVPELADTIQAVADAYAAVNDDGDLEAFLGNMQGILLEMKHDIRDGHLKTDEYGTLKKISDSLGVRTLLEVSDGAKETFMKAINEVNSHADHAASSLKAEYDFASGPYGATAGNYVAAGATVDAALGDLDDALKASMNAMGLTAGGAFDDLGDQRFVANADSLEEAVIKLDDAAMNLEDSISAAHDMASGPWSAPVMANYMAGMTIAQSLAKADDLAKKLEASLQASGFDLAAAAWGAQAGVYIDAGASVAASLQDLDEGLDLHVTDLATAGEGKGANMIKVAAEAGPHVAMSQVAVSAGATVQEVIGGFVTILDVLKADESVDGSIKDTVDNAIAGALTGASGDQLAETITQIAAAFTAVNDTGDASQFVQNLEDILIEMKHDIRDGESKADEYGTLNKIANALGVQVDLATTDKASFKSAINEVDLHADHAASSLKAGWDFADGAYGATAGNYVAAGATVDAALGDLDEALKDAMDAMGLTLAGELDGLADTRFLAEQTAVESALIELDSELDDLRTATIDLLVGDQAMVRKGDHVEEWSVATESQTEFILSGELIHLSSLMVFRNGLLLRKGDAYDYEVDQVGDVKIVLQGDYIADLDDEFCFKFIKKTSAAYSA